MCRVNVIAAQCQQLLINGKWRCFFNIHLNKGGVISFPISKNNYNQLVTIADFDTEG